MEPSFSDIVHADLDCDVVHVSVEGFKSALHLCY